MQLGLVRKSKRSLGRGAALLLVGGLAAGCSANVARFDVGLDNIFTASTPNQKSIIPQSQPYPGDAVAAAPVESAPAGSVSRTALTPVTSAPLADAKPAAETVRTASAPALAATPSAKPLLDRATTGTVPSTAPEVAAVDPDPAGWSRAGGTQIVAKEGETVYNLSRRFGVPANVIMQVNGLSEQASLQAGQKLVIPTYVYSKKAPVSAPDSNPKVADAKSSRGTNADAPKLPAPETPQDKVAVLPKAPKPKEGEPEKPASATAASAGSYTVESGDTLSKIAKKTGVSVSALKEANGLKDGNIRIGQSLKLAPGAAPAKVATATKVDPIVTGGATKAQKPAAAPSADAPKLATYTPPTTAIEQAEAEDDAEAPGATGIGKMRWPVRGRVVSNYGASGGSKNDGIDISVPEGTPVKAAENGVVIYAGDGLKEFGNTVLVRHENGLVTVYGHASALKVSRGQTVKRGQEIAVSGMSGNANTPKLHFEVRKNSAPVDPSGYLQ
ncbi:MAG: peptidoglycan DD-metalloendopeptidase family protein [Rhizobiaceae bacterium]|nr:peptidoglycan DD-metalloendopeptidase family protein [Rhizobiaceae bacterium]